MVCVACSDNHCIRKKEEKLVRLIKYIVYTPILIAIDILRATLKIAGWIVDIRINQLEREMERRKAQNV